jgi:glutaredoxin
VSDARGRVVLYSRPDCHLCDEARAGLRSMGLEIEEVDIDSDDRLHARLLERIPVVEIEGRVVSELWLDEAAVRAAITSQT